VNNPKYIGRFVAGEADVEKRLSKAKAFIFDWDGVFNNGFKLGQAGSGFSEVDSMGTNLLRFSYFLKTKHLPVTAIISGEKNESAQFFAAREHYDMAFYKIAHKIDALSYLCDHKNIKPEEVVYFFDDVLDLSIARICGLRIMISKKATKLFIDDCIQNGFIDYISANDGGDHGVRESCEMLMSINSTFSEVLKQRTDLSDTYKEYLTYRNNITTRIFTKDKTGRIIPDQS
jgi:3-deoxy-D-manno-octulosonate 8-phosphate phosphatase (KDO 8-P phosphatase)